MSRSLAVLLVVVIIGQFLDGATFAWWYANQQPGTAEVNPIIRAVADFGGGLAVLAMKMALAFAFVACECFVVRAKGLRRRSIVTAAICGAVGLAGFAANGLAIVGVPVGVLIGL